MPPLPFVACLCPTYRRPALLANAVACWLAQDYPADRRELIILDDAGQFDPDRSPHGWSITVTSRRFSSLPEKYNELAKLAGKSAGVLVPWEDDDIYLPGHLSAHVAAMQRTGMEFSKPRTVYSLQGETLTREPSAGRFHGSIAFTRRLFDQVGGWPVTKRADFDQQFMRRLQQAAGGHADPTGPERDTGNSNADPQYVFRWATGQPHAQWDMAGPADENWWQKAGERAERENAVPWIGKLSPMMDASTADVTGRPIID